MKTHIQGFQFPLKTGLLKQFYYYQGPPLTINFFSVAGVFVVSLWSSALSQQEVIKSC